MTPALHFTLGLAECATIRCVTIKRRERSKPFGAASQGASYTAEPLHASQPPGAEGKSLASLFAANGFSIRPSLLGSSELESPYDQSWIVYTCTRLWVRAVAGVGFKLYRSSAADAEEVPEGDPLLEQLKKPNRDMVWSQLAEADVVHRKLSGESFWFLFAPSSNGAMWQPFPAGKPITLPFAVTPVIGSAVEYTPDSAGRPIEWRFQSQGGVITAPWSSVVHFRDYDPSDPLRGLGAAEVANRQLQIAFAAEQQQQAQMKSGGPGAFAIYPNDLERSSKEAMQADLDAEASSPSASSTMKILGGGPTIVPNPATPDRMRFGDTLTWSRDVVCSAFEVPVHLVSPDASTYSNLKEAWIQLWHAVVAYLRTVELQVNEQLIKRMADAQMRRYYFAFDYAGIEALRDDQSARLKVAAEISIATGIPLATIVEVLGLDIDPSKLMEPEDDSDEPDLEGEAPQAQAPNAQPQAAIVADQALNGAQVSSLLDILRAVSEGLLTADGAVYAILAAFPLIGEERARQIVAGVNEAPSEPEPAAPPPAQTEEERALALAIERRAVAEKSPSVKIAKLETREARIEYHKRFTAKVTLPIERKLQKRIRKWLSAYERALLARVRKFAANGEVPKSFDSIAKAGESDALFASLLPDDEKAVAELRKALEGLLEQAFAAAAKDQAAELGTIALAPTDPRVMQSLETQLVKVVEGVNSTTAKRVKAAMEAELGTPTSFVELRQAIEDSLPELTVELQSVFADKTARATTIARTETAKAANSARDIQMREDGVSQTQWITEEDEAVRESHRKLDGEVRPLGEDFAPNLAHPHDDRAEAEEVINCRCIALAVVPEIDQ